MQVRVEEYIQNNWSIFIAHAKIVKQSKKKKMWCGSSEEIYQIIGNEKEDCTEKKDLEAGLWKLEVIGVNLKERVFTNYFVTAISWFK